MKVAVFNFNGVLDSLVNYLRMTGNLTAAWEDSDVVVLWQDVIGDMKTVAQQARLAGKRVYVVEHGLLSINDYITPLSRPLTANKIMVWGKATKEWLLQKTDIPEDKIVVTGTTVFDVFKPKRIHKGKNVLFAPRHWSPDIPENHKIAKELKKLKGAKVRSKIVAGEHSPDKYPNPIQTNRMAESHLIETYDILAETDLLVTVGEGTIAALAYYLDIPVISLNEWETKELLGKTYTKEVFFEQVSDACTRVSIGKLNAAIKEELANPTKNQAKRLRFLRDYCNYDGGNALQNMLGVIANG